MGSQSLRIAKVVLVGSEQMVDAIGRGNIFHPSEAEVTPWKSQRRSSNYVKMPSGEIHCHQGFSKASEHSLDLNIVPLLRSLDKPAAPFDYKHGAPNGASTYHHTTHKLG